VFEAYGDTEIAPLLIDSLITVNGTFCDFFNITCFYYLTLISRGPILRIQIRGTYTPKRATVESFHGAFGVGRNQAGFKLKNRRESQLRAAFGAVPAQRLVPINQPEGRAFAFYVIYS
jgi:hypothetical protein